MAADRKKRRTTTGRNEMSELQKLFAEMKSALADLKSNPKAEAAQCNVCLLTRSLYTEFYSVTELAGEFDEKVADQLREFFQTALQRLPAGKKYHKSVAERKEDFEAYCKEVQSPDYGMSWGQELDTDIRV